MRRTVLSQNISPVCDENKNSSAWHYDGRKLCFLASKCRLVSSRLSERAFSTVFDSEETTDKFFEPLFLHSANGYPHQYCGISSVDVIERSTSINEFIKAKFFVQWEGHVEVDRLAFSLVAQLWIHFERNITSITGHVNYTIDVYKYRRQNTLVAKCFNTL